LPVVRFAAHLVVRNAHKNASGQHIRAIENNLIDLRK